ncbi:MAG: hypothetical protein FJ399_23470 [Verrucomicrobia bacterium]|nr:hypothetical protein [Verrucomicrobiota bacterium]
MSFSRRLLPVALLLLAARPGLYSADDGASRWARFEPEFKAFAEADRARPPRPGGILFVGSSMDKMDRMHTPRAPLSPRRP